jgi:hypothetical protein
MLNDEIWAYWQKGHMNTMQLSLKFSEVELVWSSISLNLQGFCPRSTHQICRAMIGV